MCLAVYAASSAPLPESEWNEHVPAFYLKPVAPSDGVRRQFRDQHVYYAGSHEGCGCGFSKDESDQRCQGNYRLLADVVSAALREGASIQLFTCWEGDQTTEPETEGVIEVEQLVEPSFELKELSLLTIRGVA